MIGAELRGHRVDSRKIRRLAHLVDGTAGRAAAEQNGGRAFDHFDRLEIETIAGVYRSITNAVEKEVIERREAPQIHGVAGAPNLRRHSA